MSEEAHRVKGADLTHYTPPEATRWTGRVDDLDDRFDSDDNTAKLAAVFVFALVDTLRE